MQAVAGAAALFIFISIGNASAFTRVETLEPSVIESGTLTELTATVSGWEEGSRIVLMPGGPYETHFLPLSEPVSAVALFGQHLFISLESGELLVAQFRERGESEIIAQYRFSENRATEMEFIDGRLFMAEQDFGLHIIDFTHPSGPRQVADYRATGQIVDLYVNGKIAAMLLDGKRIVVLDVAKSDDIKTVYDVTLPQKGASIFVNGRHAIVSGTESGLMSINLSRTGAAVVLDSFVTSGSGEELIVKDDKAYVADGSGGLAIFDVSDARRIKWLGSSNTRGEFNAIALHGDRAVVAKDYTTLQMMNLKNPDLPLVHSAYKPGGVISDIAFDGMVVYAATNEGLRRIDFSDSTPGRLYGESANYGGSRRAEIRDNILYVADWFSGLHLYDISDSRRLRHISSFHSPGSSKGVTLKGYYAFVGDDDYGLQIIDISEPENPKWVSELATDGLAYTLKIVGDTLYLADHRGGFHIIDVKEPREPKLLGSFDTDGKSWAIDVKDKIAYVADDSSGLLLFDVSDPARPQKIGEFNPGGQAEDVIVNGDIAYVAFFDKGFYILDVSDPKNPVEIGHTAIPGNARSVSIDSGYAYVAGWESGLQVVDIKVPSSPKIVGQLDTTGAAWGVNVKDGKAYILDWWGGLKVADVRRPKKPKLAGSYHESGTPARLAVSGSYLYAANGIGGLQVFDIKNRLNPIWITGVDFKVIARDVWLSGNRAYVAAGGGVTVIDISDPFYAKRLGSLDLKSGAAYLVRGDSSTVYVADNVEGLVVADVSDPANVRRIKSYRFRVNDLWIDDNYLYIAGMGGLTLLDRSNPAKLTKAAVFNTDGKAKLVRSSGNLIALYESSVGVWLLGLEDGAIKKLSLFEPFDDVTDMQIKGRTLYLLTRSQGLMEVDITDPDAPQLKTVYPSRDDETTIAVAQKSVFFGGGKEITSVALLPRINSGDALQDKVTLQIPAKMPVGSYHLLALSPDGERNLLPNAIKVRYPKPKKPAFTMDDLKKIMDKKRKK